MNDLTFLLLSPLVAAVGVSLVRRWPVVSGLLGGGLVLFLRGRLANMGLETLAVFEQSFTLTPEVRSLLLFVFAGVAVLFVLSAVWEQGVDFVPAGLASLSPLSLALMADTFALGLLALVMGVALLAAVLQSGRGGSTLASLRYLAITILAIPFFLLASWMLETQQLALLSTAWRLVLLGLVILLGGFPFHIWVRPILSESPPLAGAFVLGLGQLVIVSFSARLLLANGAVWQDTSLLETLRLSGLVVIIVAAVLLFHVQEWGKLLGYVVLADMGAVLLAMSVTPAGFALLTTLLIARFASLLLAGMGLSLLRTHAPMDTFESGLGLARRAPIGLLLLVVGVLSLVGFPLTSGFAGRVALLSLVAPLSPLASSVLVLASASGVVGLLRGVMAMSRPGQSGTEADGGWQKWLPGRVTSVIGLVFGLSLAIYPQPLLDLAAQLTQLFNS